MTNFYAVFYFTKSPCEIVFLSGIKMVEFLSCHYWHIINNKNDWKMIFNIER